MVGISVRSLQRWRTEGLIDGRKGAAKNTARKLSAEEEDAVYRAANQERFADMTPEQVVASLAQESTYLASASTFYRILKRRKAVNHRSDTRTPIHHSKPPQRIATGPNQVWSWDITWLNTEVKGLWLYAYVIMDLWDRCIVGWSIHEREDGELAKLMFERACRDHCATPNFLHSDNGGPMKSYTLVEFLYSRGITLTTNRPRVSNDNPYSESLFKTVKYRASFPRQFTDLMSAMTWFAGFVDWYNNGHLHSGLAYLTPGQRRSGASQHILSLRNLAIENARAKNPLRWGKRPAKKYHLPPKVILNPDKVA